MADTPTDNHVKYVREQLGLEDLAEVFEYIRENEEKFSNGEMGAEDISNYDYANSMFILECVNFGGTWYSERVLEEEGEL
jgi:hypothetical protein